MPPSTDDDPDKAVVKSFAENWLRRGQNQQQVQKQLPVQKRFKRLQVQKQVRQQEASPTSLQARYDLVKNLAFSTEGVVCLAKSLKTGKLRVMKIVKADKPKLPREARMLAAVGLHENVVRYIEAEYFHSRGIAVMSMEYCNFGDLFDLQRHLTHRKLETPIELVLQVLVNVIEGLAFIHGGWVRHGDSYRSTGQSHGIVHGDVKCENTLAKNVGGPLPIFKIGDFGQAFDSNEENRQGGGTDGFQAPELFKFVQPELMAKADVYSFGIMMLSLCQGVDAELHPCGEPAHNLRLPKHLDKYGIQALLRRCLEVSPKDRPDMSPAGALWYVPGFRTALEDMKDEIATNVDTWMAGFRTANPE